ncbi:ANTAR domain-containing response regulator [Photobacterium galatheae]|nr:ANTAR domain-containing protein [Photobacterium galatheae]MCM0151143.1 ANTAR domain-containing protein [Photobacterium galatheae]
MKKIVVCSDCTREQARLTGKLAGTYDDVTGCGFSRLTELVSQAQSAVLVKSSVLVISWARADAELRHMVSQAGCLGWPLVVMIRQLEPQDIQRLPGPNGYVLLPGDSATALSVWVERAWQVRQAQCQLKKELVTLSRRLEERRLIEQAKGLLMKLHGLDESEAYKLLRNAAMQQSLSLGQIAKNLMISLNR